MKFNFVPKYDIPQSIEPERSDRADENLRSRFQHKNQLSTIATPESNDSATKKNSIERIDSGQHAPNWGDTVILWCSQHSSCCYLAHSEQQSGTAQVTLQSTTSISNASSGLAAKEHTSSGTAPVSWFPLRSISVAATKSPSSVGIGPEKP